MNERDLLLASIRPGVKFNVYPQYSRIFSLYKSNKLSKLNIEPKQKGQISMLIDRINHYNFLNLCVIQN